MQAIWTEDEAEYHGDLVHLERIWSWPKPLQKPHPPVLLGSNGPRSASACCATRTAGSRTEPSARPRSSLRSRRAQRPRRRARRPTPARDHLRRAPDDHAVLERYAEAGVARILLALPTAPAEEVRPLVKHDAYLVERYR